VKSKYTITARISPQLATVVKRARQQRYQATMSRAKMPAGQWRKLMLWRSSWLAYLIVQANRGGHDATSR
jgi:hypothetical protein